MFQELSQLMSQRSQIGLCLASFALLTWSPQSFARGGTGPSLLAASEGFAAPSIIAPLSSENPAGVISNDSFKLLGFGTNNANDQFAGGAGIFAGNGSVGAGVAAEKGDGYTTLHWGLGVQIPGVNVALGVSGHGDSGTDQLTVGMILNSGETVSAGLVLLDADDGVDLIGGGVAFSSGRETVFVLDAAANLPADAFGIKPGIRMQVQKLSLTVSYGIELTDTTAAPINEGVTAGLGIALNDSFMLHGYYEHVSRAYAGLVYSF